MESLANQIESVILSRPAMGVAILLVIALALRAGRESVREAWLDPNLLWRRITRIGAVVSGTALLWVALFDDWLQLVAEPFRLSMKWQYQRVVYDPVDPAIRTITVILLAAMVVMLALLFARCVGGYAMQLGVLILSAIAWVPLYVMGQRMNSMVVQGAESSNSLLETLGLAAFWVVRVGLGIAAIAVTLLTAMMVVALVATLILDALNLRQDKVTGEADSFFSELGSRAGEHEDVPLRAFWRPIRRPL